MDLNKDNEEGLDPTFNPADFSGLDNDPLLRAPTHNTGAAVQLTTVTPTTQSGQVLSDPTAQDVLGDNLELGKLPQLQADFVLVSDQASEIVTLKEVEEAICSDGVISQESAKMVENYFPNFLHDRLIIQEFTKQPSKVNYTKATSHMHSKLSMEDATLGQQMRVMLTIPLPEVSPDAPDDKLPDTLTTIQRYLAIIESEHSALVTRYGGTLEKVGDNKNLVFPTQDGFVNIMTQPLAEVLTIVPQRNRAFGQFMDAMTGIQKLLTSPHLVDYLTQASGEPLSVLSVPSQHALLVQRGMEVTLNDLVTIYRSGDITKRLVDLEQAALASITYFTRLRTELAETRYDVPAGTSTVTPAHALFLRELAAMTDSVERLHYVQLVIQQIRLLSYAMQTVMAYLEASANVTA